MADHDPETQFNDGIADVRDGLTREEQAQKNRRKNNNSVIDGRAVRSKPNRGPQSFQHVSDFTAALRFSY